MAIRQMRAHQFHDFFVWWRRCLSRLTRDNGVEWESRPMIPAKAKQQLTDMIAQVTSNTPVRVRKIPVVKPGDAVDLDDESLPVLVVDATLHGYGGVLYERGRVVASFGDKFASKAESMGTAEIAAALAMIRHFAPRLQGRKFVCARVPPSTLTWTVQRTRSIASSTTSTRKPSWATSAPTTTSLR